MNHPAIPTVREILTFPVVTLRPDLAAIDAAQILFRRRISGAPVVDDEGRLLGMLSQFDCLRAVASAGYEMDDHDAAVTVADLMTPGGHTVPPDLDLFGLAHQFVRLRVRRFPVLEDGRVIGLVSRHDALGAAIRVRAAMQRVRKGYPDYPAGRDPIDDYPRRR